MNHALSQQQLVELLTSPSSPLFGELVLLVDDVELELNIKRFGYPKDNAFSHSSLADKLRDADYLHTLIDMATLRLEEDDDDAPVLLELLDMLQKLKKINQENTDTYNEF